MHEKYLQTINEDLDHAIHKSMKHPKMKTTNAEFRSPKIIGI